MPYSFSQQFKVRGNRTRWYTRRQRAWQLVEKCTYACLQLLQLNSTGLTGADNTTIKTTINYNKNVHYLSCNNRLYQAIKKINIRHETASSSSSVGLAAGLLTDLETACSQCGVKHQVDALFIKSVFETIYSWSRHNGFRQRVPEVNSPVTEEVQPHRCLIVTFL